jgi:putative tricarboxylic transport membrane protein
MTYGNPTIEEDPMFVHSKIQHNDSGARPFVPPARARRRAQALLALTSVIVLAGCSQGGSSGNGEDYPTDPLEYIVPYNPGGSSDPIGREFSRRLAEELGTSETVLNMPGGDETIGITHVLNSDPDGHTLGLASTGGIVAQPLINEDLQFDGRDDYTPIIKMIDTPYALLVAADSPYETLEDFVAAAKESPGEVRVGLSNRLANSGFTLFALEDQAGIKTTVVPFSGGAGESVLAVLGGQIEAIVATASGQLGQVESGELRALAYTGSGYEEFLPEATSFEDAGYDIPFTADYMTVAPAGLPEAAKEKLTAAAEKVAKSEEWAEWCRTQGNLPDSLVGTELDSMLDEKQEILTDAVEGAQSREE